MDIVKSMTSTKKKIMYGIIKYEIVTLEASKSETIHDIITYNS